MFNIGDRVKCVDDSGYENRIAKGNVYTVAKSENVYGIDFVSLAETDSPSAEAAWLAKRFVVFVEPSPCTT